MELSQKYLPLEKRFALVVSHNKWLMCRNALLEEELVSHVALKEKYDDLKWQFDRLKEQNDAFKLKLDEIVESKVVFSKKKHKVAFNLLKQHGLFQKYLNETRG